MLDPKRVRQNPDELRAGLARKGMDTSVVDELLEIDEQRRQAIQKTEEYLAARNRLSGFMPLFMAVSKAGSDAEQLQKQKPRVEQFVQACEGGVDEESYAAEAIQAVYAAFERGSGDSMDLEDAKANVLAKIREVGDEADRLRGIADGIETQFNDLLLAIPNIPNPEVPEGPDEETNVEVRKVGTPPEFDFEPKPHWDLGESLGILDFESAAKVTGSRFTFLRGAGARLERSITAFMLDTHTQESGYTEVFPPYMVHRHSMVGTGQLPKFEEDAFKVMGTDYFLIPTAEVPVTNIHRESVLDLERLPITYCAYSACFRSEAGSAGRDTRGLIRQHQFNKVELVHFSKPEESYQMHEKLTADAEKILQKLGLAYRVVLLSAGDMSAASAKTYDLEVWMPSYGRYVEISSCSNFESYQARRAGIRYRNAEGKTEFVHTLNGSGLAVGRTSAAIMENFQQADGSIKVPDALVPYMGTDVIRP